MNLSTVQRLISVYVESTLSCASFVLSRLYVLAVVAVESDNFR
jgi:hypothetical protein